VRTDDHKAVRNSTNNTPLEGIPAPCLPPVELRDLRAWLIWKFELFPGESKPRKLPYYTTGGKRYGHQGSDRDRESLTTFAAARDAAERRGFDGVGFSPLPEFGIVALDFDKCIGTDGSIPDEIKAVIAGTYAETSPSGLGVRSFLLGNLGNHKSSATSEQFGFETFSSSGFVTFTGNALPHVELLGLENTIAPINADVKSLCDRRFGSDRQAPGAAGDDPFAGLEKPLGLPINRMTELLSQLDPDLGRDDWVKIGMALHHECGGDDIGFELWDGWSAGGGKYPSREALQAQWESFARPRPAGRRPITMASVIRMFNEARTERAKQREVAVAEELHAAASEAKMGVPSGSTATPSDFNGKYPITSADTLAKRPPPGWLIKDVLPEADVAVVFGSTGSGKSFIATDMGASIVRGIPWRGHKTKQGRVLIIAAEGGGGVGKRLKAYAQHHKIDLKDLQIGVITAAPNFLLKEEILEVVTAAKSAGGFDLIITDTFAQVTPGANENAGEDMGLALGNAKALREATGALVLLIHHSGKDATKGARGWSGIKAAADAEFEVTKHDGDVRKITITKMKDGEEGQSFAFKLKQIGLGFDKDCDAITSCVVEPADGFPSTKIKRSGPRGPIQKLLHTAASDLGADTFEGADVQAVIVQAAQSMKLIAGQRDQRLGNAKRTLDIMRARGVLVLRNDRLYSHDWAPPPAEGAGQ
jgi:hypothetical protein